MAGLLEEGKEVLEQDGNPSVLDAALIAAAQRVEHYEMAGYGCARIFAQLLGERDAATVLEKTLEEEKEADRKLTEIAESHINVQAQETSADEGEEGKGNGRERSTRGRKRTS
jgi:ferritin-like metal-binding protein YciE